MKKSLEKRTLEGTLASGIGIGVSLIQSFVLVPFFLKFWGPEKYGAWISLYAFILLLRSLEIGYHSYVGNDFNKAYHVDRTRAQQILGSSIRFSVVIALLEVIVYCFIAWGPYAFSVIGVDAHQLAGFDYRYGLFLFVLIWAFLGYSVGLLVRITLAEGFFAKNAYFGLVYKICEIIILASGAFLGWSLFTVCVAYAFVTAIYYGYYFYFIRNRMPDFYPWWRSGTWVLGAKLYYRSLVITLNGFLDQFGNSGLLLIVSKFIGLVFVPVLSTIRALTNFLLQIANLVTHPLAPDLIRYNTLGEKQKLQYIFETHWFLSGWLVSLPFMISTLFIEPVFHWWVGGKLLFDKNLYYQLALSVAFINFGRMFTVYFSGINANLPLLVIGIFRVIIFIVTLLLHYPSITLHALGLSVLIAELACSFVIPSVLIFKTIFKRDHENIMVHYHLSWLQLLLLAVGFYAAPLFQGHQYYFIVLCFLLIGTLSLLQWRYLNAEVRNRLGALLFKW